MSHKTIEFSNTTDCPHSGAWALPRIHHPLNDAEVLAEVNHWMNVQLPCAAGRREFKRKRYMIEIANRQTVPDIFERYKKALENQEAVACLFVFNNHAYSYDKASVFEAFEYLAYQMEPIGNVAAYDLARGAALTNAIELTCPITNTQIMFDDFECIAFCPQSNNPQDPLYDPLLAMPFTAVNLSSDMYAFSKFVADEVQKISGKKPYEIDDLVFLRGLFLRCIDRWQRVAVSTINRYQSLTDTKICPVHVTNDQKYWIAHHKDPAFAEAVKETHKHELPTEYGLRIVESWMNFFQNGQTHQASGLARDGTRAA